MMNTETGESQTLIDTHHVSLNQLIHQKKTVIQCNHEKHIQCDHEKR